MTSVSSALIACRSMTIRPAACRSSLPKSAAPRWPHDPDAPQVHGPHGEPCDAGAAGAVSREVWRGRAFGGDVSLDLTGPRDRVAADLVRLTARMRELEARFTLYEDDGPLVRLNLTGKGPLHGDLRRVMEVSRRVHVATNGVFDPTVQSLWAALAEGRGADLSAVGLDRVRMTDTEITLAKGQALTFNGIAQGYAADALRAMLSGWGYSTALVDMGEQAALGGPFRLGLVDPAAGRIGQVTLTGQAAATSSPAAMTIGGVRISCTRKAGARSGPR